MVSSEILCGAGSRALQNTLQALQEALYVPVSPGKNQAHVHFRVQSSSSDLAGASSGCELGHKSLAEVSPNHSEEGEIHLEVYI